MINKEFTISFKINVEKNPKWKDVDSSINFPPITTGDGVKVFFSKIKTLLKAYVLHPDVKYRKLSIDVSEYLNQDIHVVLTNSESETKLYINGKLVKTLNIENFKENLEEGDYVLIKPKQGDLKSISFDKSAQIILWGKIESIKNDSINLELFQPPETVTLPKDRIHF